MPRCVRCDLYPGRRRKLTEARSLGRRPASQCSSSAPSASGHGAELMRQADAGVCRGICRRMDGISTGDRVWPPAASAHTGIRGTAVSSRTGSGWWWQVGPRPPSSRLASPAKVARPCRLGLAFNLLSEPTAACCAGSRSSWVRSNHDAAVFSRHRDETPLAIKPSSMTTQAER